MSNLKKVTRLIKKANKQEQQALVNFHYSVEQVKQQRKQIFDETSHVELFNDLKTNLIIINKVDDVGGFAQLIKEK